MTLNLASSGVLSTVTREDRSTLSPGLRAFLLVLILLVMNHVMNTVTEFISDLPRSTRDWLRNASADFIHYTGRLDRMLFLVT